MTDTDLRQRFEKWISGPPYEHSVRRYPNNSTSWPGCYADYRVHLAWDAYRAGMWTAGMMCARVELVCILPDTDASQYSKGMSEGARHCAHIIRTAVEIANELSSNP